MGNNSSATSGSDSNKAVQSFPKIMETIAEKYILTHNFEDMTKLSDPNYCNKLVVLTSELLNENLNTHEIEYMVQKTKAGMDVYEKTKQTLTFLPAEQFSGINRQISPLQKKRMCVGIARFFIRIAQIYSAIFMTINPVYVYTDSYGNKNKISLKDKKSLPPNVITEKIYLNLCNQRLDYLTKNSSIPDNDQSTETMFVKPDFCSYGATADGDAQKLSEQIGLKELEKLYYDVYDYDAGKFNKMSSTMKEQYNKDLFTLYSVFSDSNDKELPAEVKTFSDIKLRLYKNKQSCNKPKNPFNIKHYGTMKDTLFREYATHVKTMKQKIQDRQQKLLDVIKKLFISVVDQSTGKTTFSIHPELNVDTLQDINKDVILLLVDQYVSCENDYIKGLEIYESIVESKLKKLTESQIKLLEQQMKNEVDKISS